MNPQKSAGQVIEFGLDMARVADCLRSRFPEKSEQEIEMLTEQLVLQALDRAEKRMDERMRRLKD